MTRLLTSVWLAAPQPGDYDPSTGRGPEWGKAAPIGLLVILLLAVAVVFLLRSFTRQLKKVPASFDSPGPDDSAGPDDSPGPGAAGSAGRAPAATRADTGAPRPGAVAPAPGGARPPPGGEHDPGGRAEPVD